MASERPVPVSKDELLRILANVVEHIENNDSFEGRINYGISEDPDADFEVIAVYRIGNSEGQGGMRVIANWSEPDGGG